METIVKITWDSPKEQDWLCAENIKHALRTTCPNTRFEVEEIKIKTSIMRSLKIEQIKN